MRAIRVHEPGGPEALVVDDVDVPVPGPGQARVRVEAAGLNFIDVYQRRGLYPLALPFVAGSEGAGVVEAVGAGVDTPAVGNRVAWATQLGSFAEQVVVDADRLVAVPDGVDIDIAAALLLQGMTAHYLAVSTFPLQRGSTALVHAAAGGVGQLLVQIAKRRGARVLATASSEDKQRLAREAGADEVIAYRNVDWVGAVDELTGGAGVDVVYDSVGADTFEGGLECLRPRGCMVLYGQSSGPVAPVDPQALNQKGSLYLTRPSLGAYVAGSELHERAGELLAWVGSGELRVRVDRSWPLEEAAAAYRYLEEGRTRGKVLLRP